MNCSCYFICAGALLFASACPAKTNEVGVKVDAAKIVRTVDARLFGVNTAIWDSYFDSTDTVLALRELDVQALRFPGGSLSDAYHWASHTTIGNRRTWPTSFSSFVHVATNIQAQVFIPDLSDGEVYPQDFSHQCEAHLYPPNSMAVACLD